MLARGVTIHIVATAKEEVYQAYLSFKLYKIGSSMTAKLPHQKYFDSHITTQKKFIWKK